MVLEGWRLTTLEDISEACAPIRYGVVQIGEDTVGGIPIVPIKYINSIATSRLHRVSKDIEGKYTNSRVQAGDVLISVKGTIGAVGIVPDGFLGNIAREIARIRPSEKYDSKYIALQLQAEKTQREINSLTVGTTRREFSIHALRKFAIWVPPFPEQKKIAEILSTWDKAITTTEQLIANSHQQKKALMQQLLTGKKRLLDNNEVRFSGEWNVRKIDDIGEIKSAGVDKKNTEGETAVRLLNFTDVFRKTYIKSDNINHWVSAPDSKVSGCNVLKGDVFFTPSSETRDEVGMSSVIYEDIDHCCYSYHIVRFRIKEEWDLNFKAFAFSTASFRRQVSVLADGSGQRYVVSQDGFRSVIISYPSLDEQRKIGKVLEASEDVIITLEKKLNTLKQEKKALMQQLLTGKRRVTLN